MAQTQRYATTEICRTWGVTPVTGVPGWIVMDSSAGTGWAGEVEVALEVMEGLECVWSLQLAVA